MARHTSPEITEEHEFPDNHLAMTLFGEQNSNLKVLPENLNLQVTNRGNIARFKGPQNDVDIAKDVLTYLYNTLKDGAQNIEPQDVLSAIRFAKKNLYKTGKTTTMTDEETRPSQVIKLSKRDIKARTPNQAIYIEALHKSDMIFGMGPAGTGKTYIAVAKAVSLYEKGEVEKMIFCRPAVEAGEKLGFLPGDLKEKTDPYLAPIYDALYDFLGAERTENLLAKKAIEIAPLAFMRGRTLSQACVVLDEAQNTTSAQMKMFLSRMGDGSKMIINGDPHQIDLLPNQISGLKEADAILKDIKEVAFVEFDHNDVVRHTLVAKILRAYDQSSHGY